MSTIASHSPLNISETVRGLIQRTTIEMVYGESNGHVTDDVTYPKRSSRHLSRKQLEMLFNNNRTRYIWCEAVPYGRLS